MKAYLLIILTVLVFIQNSDAQFLSKAETERKLDRAKTVFRLLDYSTALSYLNHWQSKRGTTRVPSATFCNVRVVRNEFDDHREKFVASVRTGLRSGRFRPDRTYALDWEDGIGRSVTSGDFFFAIGGCTLKSHVKIRIGKPDREGNVRCTFTDWKSYLKDIYKFDKHDAYFNPLNLTQGFRYDECAGYARAGNAKDFKVESNALKIDASSFTARVLVWNQG